MERTDLARLSELYEVFFRSGTPHPPPQLAGYFERTLFDHPWADPEVPSLVYEGAGGEILGVIGVHARRLRVDGRALRLCCSGPLLVDPDPRHRGVGAVLLRRFLRGPQDVSITDAGNTLVHDLWTALGGQSSAHASIWWTKVLRPASAVHAMLEQRDRLPGVRWTTGLVAPALDAAAAAVTRRAGRSPAEPAGSSEELTVGSLVEQTRANTARLRLYVDYDERYLRWIFTELDALAIRGTPVRRLVRGENGRVAGWFVYFRLAAGISEVLQVAAAPGDADLVLDHLFHDAARGGSAAVQGRVEPQLSSALHSRRLHLSRSAWALVHAEDPALLGLLGGPKALLTRLDGEYWIGYHLLWR